MKASSKNDVVAVVVTHNRKDMLRQNLQCLLGQEGASCDIFVVDNASDDGTAEMIATEFDMGCVNYVNTGENLGGAGGFSYGINAVFGYDYKYVWIMDDDCLPQKTALSELLRGGVILGNWGFLSSAVYWTDGSLCLANRPKKDLFRHISTKDLDGDPVRVRMGSFVSMLVPMDVISEVGLPMAEYFIWTDDYEFSGRISKRYPCYVVPASKVVHAMTVNTRADLVTASGERISRFRLLYRNDGHCYRQFGLEGHAYLLSKALYTGIDVLFHAKDNKRERLQILIQGYKDGFSFSPQVSYPDKQKKIP